MANLNQVQLIGNAGSDPEGRTTTAGARVATLSLATSEKWRNDRGQDREETQWHRLVFWDSEGRALATLAERYVKKGHALYVAGKIKYKQWQDAEGQTRYSTEIHVQNVQFLTPKKEGE